MLDKLKISIKPNQNIKLNNLECKTFNIRVGFGVGQPVGRGDGLGVGRHVGYAYMCHMKKKTKKQKKSTKITIQNTTLIF